MLVCQGCARVWDVQDPVPTDAEGNLNVSRFGDRIVGPGSFVNISSSAKKVVFIGTMTVGAQYAVENRKIIIVKEGDKKKFVKRVDHITFSGDYARKMGKSVLYVTERAVFSLEKDGLTLIEVAPGLNVEKDIISAMEFRPRISPALKEMPRELFARHWGKLKEIFGKSARKEEAAEIASYRQSA